MRKIAVAFAFALALWSSPGRTDEPPRAAPLPPPKEHTTVRGTLPADLPGRWLTAGWIELPNDKYRTTTALWEMAQDGGQLVLRNHFVELPPAQVDAVAAANQAEKPWRPTPEDLAALAAAWDSLPPADPRLAEIENELVGRDGFDDSFTKEARSKDAVWVVRQAEVFDPSASPAIKQINVFAALAPKDGGWTGNYTAATLAAAPFPIPITFNGKFESYRLTGGAAASRGLIARLLDLFSGCGRR